MEVHVNTAMRVNLSSTRVTDFASMVFRKNPNLAPDEGCLRTRLNILQTKLLKEETCPFVFSCCNGAEERPCFLVKCHGAWNSLLIPCGLQLQCYAAGWLSLSTLHVPRNRCTQISADTLSSVLLVLWLLHEHNSINRLDIDPSVAFGDLTEQFFESALFKPQLQQITVTLPPATPPLVPDGRPLLRSLRRMTSLQRLELHRIPISRYAVDEFCLLLESNTHLKFVSLSNVPMSVDCTNDLVTAFNSCVALETIHLSPIFGNSGRVESLRETVLGKSSVQELSINFQIVNSFPFEGFALSENIKILKLLGFVDAPNLLYLSQALKRNNILRVLAVSLSACSNYTVLSAFADAIGVNTGLLQLHLQDLTAIGDVAVHLAHAVVDNHSLQTLSIEGRYLRAIDVKVLAVALLGNRSLKQLKIRGSESLSEKLQGLQELLIDADVSSRLCVDYGPTYIPFLTRFLRNGNRMETLTVTGQGAVKSADVVSFSMSLRLNSALTNLTVSLPGDFPPISVDYLVHLFKTSSSLRFVSLSLIIDIEDMCRLFEALEVSENILSLQLDRVAFDQDSTDVFFRMLQRNRSLIHLVIYRLDDASVQLLTQRLPDGLDGNCTLLTMNLFRLPQTEIDTRMCARLFCKNQRRLSLAVGFVERTSTDAESEEAFRTLLGSRTLIDKLKEVTGESEIIIRGKIRMCMTKITATTSF